MQEINTVTMFEEVLAEIMKFAPKNIDVQVNDGDGEVNLSTNKYQLRITINDKWVGYDFMLDKSFTDGASMGSAADTDLYALDYDVKFTKKIFEELHFFLDSLLSNKLYYGFIDGRAVFAEPINQTEYSVTVAPKRRFFVSISSQVWPMAKVLKNPHLKQLVADDA